ncbi:hypothetical protein ACTXT7_002597 [Hymenolepis weldensis]
MRSGSGKECDEVESVEVGMLMEGIGRGWMWCGELDERIRLVVLIVTNCSLDFKRSSLMDIIR